MAINDLHISKMSVKDFFQQNNEGKKFLIPDYQRPYCWTEEQVETLLDDLYNFYKKNKGNDDAFYFLGNIITYQSKDKKYQEIIDGQQRVTTFFLLLRAFYTDIEDSYENDKDLCNLKGVIGKLIFATKDDVIINDKSEINIESRVAFGDDWKSFLYIMKNGKCEEQNGNKKNCYKKNYGLIREKTYELMNDKFFNYYDFIKTILNKAVVLPITTMSLEGAMEIFETLNDRGLQLSDADIFKAKIYGSLNGNVKEQQEFVETWKEYLRMIKSANGDSNNKDNLTIDKVFMCYMFYIRAQDNDKDSTTTGLRKYFLDKEHIKLLTDNDKETLSKLKDIIMILSKMKIPEFDDEQHKWMSNDKIKKLFHIIKYYQNDWCKYPIVCFYFTHKENKDFEKQFIEFLQKLIVYLIASYIKAPAVNNIKGDILQLNINCVNQEKKIPEFTFEKAKNLLNDETEFFTKFNENKQKIEKMILLMLTYSKKKQCLVYNERIEIEHIFPKGAYLSEKDEATMEQIFELMGNKLLLEKKLNIKAGNKIYERKKEEYKKSKFEITKEFIDKYKQQEWTINNIIERDYEVRKQIINILRAEKFFNF